MLSMSNVSSGSAQSGYYKAEGYYLEGSKEAEAGSQYFGKAAQAAGLTGQVDDKRFSELLAGETPTGQIMGRVLADGTRQHRNGIDLTFSAPKGVSIAALVGGDDRVIAAHTEAVKTAMAYVESDIVQTRTKRDGEITVHTGGKIIAGLFQHDTSRALDPQLHTHAVIANMIQGSDGHYKALHNDKLYKNKMVIGQAYRNALSQNLEKLGYTIERKDKGLFDIKEVPKELVESFSTRREEIVAALEAKDLAATPQNSALAALATRSAKKPVSRDELRAAWSSEVEKSGHDLSALRQDLQKNLEVVQEKSGASGHDTPKNQEANARKADGRSPETAQAKPEAGHDPSRAVEFAVTHLAERASVYERAKVIETALKQDFRAEVKSVEAFVDHLIAEKVLFTTQVKGEPYLTDVQNVGLEKDSILQLHRGRATPLDVRTTVDKAWLRTNEGALDRRLGSTTLTEGQREAVKLGLSSEEGRFVGVQGLAGTGKTFMLRTLAQYAAKAGYEVEGIAPTLKAVEALSEAIPNSRTIESALVMAQHRGPADPDKKSILVVDEASMVSTAKMNEVLKLANQSNYDRVVLVGDIKQLEAVGAGSPFRLLQRNGLNVALMADVQRQRTEEGRQAVLHAYAGEVREAFSNIEPVKEVEKGEDRKERRSNIAGAMAAEYLSRNPEHRDQTGIVVMTNEMRGMVNKSVQAGRAETGELKGDAVKLETLVPHNFSWAEKREIESYKTGDIVTTTRDLAKLGIEAKVLYAVSKVDVAERTLTLSAPDGSERNVPMGPDDKASTKFITYKSDEQNIYAGDKVKFKITDRDHGVINAATGTVVAIQKDVLIIENKDGERTELPTDSMAVKGMQLAYASTAHNFQGASINQVLVGLDSTEQLATQKALYVSVSRMTEATQIYTDDATRLTSTIERQTGERLNALEALEGDKTPRFEERKLGSDERRDQVVIERETEAQKPPEISVENQPPKPDEKSVERPAENPSVKAEKDPASERDDPRIQDDLFARLVEQLPNQMERGDRER